MTKTETIYVIVKRCGRGAYRAPYHLLGPDGSIPLCGTALRRLDLFQLIPVSDVGMRKLCSRCAAQRTS